MFAYCGNNPINKVDPTGEFAISLGMILFATLCVTVVATATIYVASQSRPIASPGPSIGISIPRRNYPSISLPKNKSKSQLNAKAKAKDAVTSLPKRDNRKGSTYYHATGLENVAKIKSTGKLIGSSTEYGFVYAWRALPNLKAVKNSGFRATDNIVIISFKTVAAFEPDKTLESQAYGPLRSVLPGPISVWDVNIVS